MGRQARRALGLFGSAGALVLLQHCSSPTNGSSGSTEAGAAGEPTKPAGSPQGGMRDEVGGVGDQPSEVGGTAVSIIGGAGDALGGTDAAGGAPDGPVATVLRCEKAGEYCSVTSDCHYFERCVDERCVRAEEGTPCTPDTTTKYLYPVARVAAPDCGVAQFCRAGQCANRPVITQSSEDAISMAACGEDQVCVNQSSFASDGHSCQAKRAKIDGWCRDTPCEDQLYCHPPNPGELPYCKPRGGLHEPCLMDIPDSCLTGLVCNFQNDGSNLELCTPAEAPVGSACWPDVTDSDNVPREQNPAYPRPCELGSHCEDIGGTGSTVGKCVSGVLAAGESCAAGPDYVCAPGTYCASAPDPKCTPGHYCPPLRTCQPTLPPGAVCNKASLRSEQQASCGSNAICHDDGQNVSHCAKVAAPGADCTDARCTDGYACVHVPVSGAGGAGDAGGAPGEDPGGAPDIAWLNWPTYVRPAVAATATCSANRLCWIAAPSFPAQDQKYTIGINDLLENSGGNYASIKTFNDHFNAWSPPNLPDYVGYPLPVGGFQEQSKYVGWSSNVVAVCNDDHLWVSRSGTWTEVPGGPSCWPSLVQVDGDGRIWIGRKAAPAGLWIYDGDWHAVPYPPDMVDLAVRGHDAWVLGSSAYRLSGTSWDKYDLPAGTPPKGKTEPNFASWTVDGRVFFGFFNDGDAAPNVAEVDFEP